MKILPVSCYENNKAPNYKSSYRAYNKSMLPNSKDFDNLIIRTSTNLFRDDLDWNGFIKYLMFHFSGKDKVNTYSMACSDGSEAYTYAISLMKNFTKELYSRFLPVSAADIDGEIIKKAQLGRINIEDCEFYYINRIGIDLNSYFKNKDKPIEIINDVNSQNTLGLFSYEPIPELRQSVNYKQSDILTELSDIHDNGNSVIMCRNVMPYLNDSYIDKIVKKASDVLKDGSLFVVGDYDELKNIGERLLQNGFYRPLIENKNVFQKGDSKELTDRLYSGYLI